MGPDDPKRRPKLLIVLGVALGSGVLSVLSYVAWLVLDTLVGLDALVPSVAPDMTITSNVPPSANVSALVFAVGAGLLAGAICYAFGESARGLWPISGFAVTGGPALTWAVFAFVGAMFSTTPGASLPWWIGIFPEPSGYLSAALVMLMPALAATLGLWLGRSRAL